VANRGEIACRIMRTAKKLNIRTVAVCSSADKCSMQVEMADEAVLLGPPPAAQSYLLGEKIIDAALMTGAEAIHPGYGFLSENADFAALCEKRGITFIGPPSQAIRAMGSKSEAKRIMAAAGIRALPGYSGQEQSPLYLAERASEIGYPFIIKPVMGGGGKGMRIVRNSSEFSDALESSKREARASFGNDEVLLERYITRPRHVEVQIFADSHGRCIHLFDRDCSIQRRHQKVIEEAPAPGLSDAVRAEMASLAIKAALAVGYCGAGTVEFIVDTERNNEFYFMEMNTRLQVEHPVTEMVTGLDLVQLQLEVAAGYSVPPQSAMHCTGHAIEARVCAENPDMNFMPGFGPIERMLLPPFDVGTRVDTGFRAGDDITSHYDSMIAKLIVHGPTRKAAIEGMITALSDFHIRGPQTNMRFLRRIARHPAFQAEDLFTGFIDKYQADLIK